MPLTWRAMTEDDLGTVTAIAARVHAAYPEDAAVFAERLRLFPAGCLVAVGTGDGVVGYLLSHPWGAGAPPALNVRLFDLPRSPVTYYLHDIALVPEARGQGAGVAGLAACIGRARALGLGSVSLVAVHGTVAYWQDLGFRIVADDALAAGLASYDADARFMRRDLA